MAKEPEHGTIVVEDSNGDHITIPHDTPQELLDERDWHLAKEQNLGGTRKRKVRDEGWMAKAIADGVIADPATLTFPTAADITAALFHANGRHTGVDDAFVEKVFANLPQGHTVSVANGETSIVYTPGFGEYIMDADQRKAAEGVFAVPTAIVEKTKE